MQTLFIMKSVLFYDTKEYEKTFLDEANNGMFLFDYTESKLNVRTASIAKGYDAVCIFVNDNAKADVLRKLYENGIRLLLLRCSGFNHVDVREAERLGITVKRVPGYSPHSVAEHAMAMLLTLNRKIHKAYIRTRDFNFSLNHLMGFDLYGKTAGIIGTGKIGKTFAEICGGFGMNVTCYDPYPDRSSELQYVSMDELLRTSDVISLHCPLTENTKYLIDAAALRKMKSSCILVNTSRGGLIDSQALYEFLLSGSIGGACLDVYEEEANLFYEDNSMTGVGDRLLSLIVSRPNVIVTSHQAYFTREALRDIAKTTVENFKEFCKNHCN